MPRACGPSGLTHLVPPPDIGQPGTEIFNMPAITGAGNCPDPGCMATQLPPRSPPQSLPCPREGRLGVDPEGDLGSMAFAGQWGACLSPTVSLPVTQTLQ